jgi:MFS family permease
MNNEPCTLDKHAYLCHIKQISWSAIIVGALVGIGLGFLLNLFSVAIGLSLVTTSKEGIITLAVGGFIGLLIGTLVSMFLAGFAAGFLGRFCCVKRNLGVLYGFTTWCFALLITVVLASSMANYVAAYSEFITTPTSVVVANDNTTPAVTASTQARHTDVTVNAQKATNNLGISALLVFVLFFIGAIASCFGGHYGMVCESGCNSATKVDDTDLTR